MATPNELLTRLSLDVFGSVINMAPKKVREELFRRAGIKNKGGAFALRSSQKTEARIRRLHEAMTEGADVPEEICEEVVRHYLYHRRELLADALDFLEVEHDEGLTDAELDFLSELPIEKAEALRTKLLEKHASDDVGLYLGFMRVPLG